jgi:site-specific DNA-methyltransferase (adenine-specific)
MSQCEIASISGQQKIDYYHKNWSGGVRHHITIHPCQKPVQLYQYLLLNYANKGDKIFDSHVGSASSLIACHLEGFEFVGCELDPDYYEEAKQRLEEYQKQKSLFQ